jgi:cytochrome c oxidase subunit 3
MEPALLAANTLVLCVSSACARAAWSSVNGGRTAASLRWSVASGALGAAFLAGQALQFARLGGWRPAGELYATLFEVLAGFHGLHVALGIGLWLAALTWLRRARSPGRAAPMVRAAELYWHFVTIVWLGLLVIWFAP